MIKRGNNKKKKGFTLIELIIVLAVMAIIALIAIPNFAAVRENSKVKADKQSCETIERTILMLVSDETIVGAGTVTYNTGGKSVVPDGVKTKGGDAAAAKIVIDKALTKVENPQITTNTKYNIVITDADVVVTTTN
ncbi:MAG: prepilin-type N-terminal cleavage/methylation domain-containing protein [Clostridium sp.]|uniref:prepilin-type N-terminal cleavage/methylation domain-containing protein n=1 Tax=Clostridium sp. TaxID=1506 RepID=UPI00305CB73D